MTHAKKIIALVAAIFLHAAALFLFYLNQQDRSHFLSALWSGGKSGGEAVTMVDITTLIEDDVSLADDVQNKDDQVVPNVTSKNSAVKIKTHDADAKKNYVNKKQVTGHGQGTSDTPVGGVGSGLDVTGSPESKSVLAQIRKKIMRKKVYPIHAQENNITGDVTLVFQISDDGGLKSVVVKKSSGSNELDEAAVNAVKHAAPLPYYPAAIVLTMTYRISD